MKKYKFDEIVDRSNTFSMKVGYLPENAPADTLPLWIADMDFPCADPILQAIHDRVNRSILGYSEYNDDRIKTSVQNWFKKRHDWTIDKEDIFYSPGVVPAIAILINILSEEGDGIVIQSPVYYPFTEKIKSNKRNIINNSLKYVDGKYSIDFEDLDRKLSLNTAKGMILCNPHNPVGRSWSAEELSSIVSVCKKHNKWIIADEIHCDIIRKDHIHTPVQKVADGYEKIVVCTAPSKSFNLAGLQFSNIIISKAEYKVKWNQFISDRFALVYPNPLSIAAMIAAYDEGEEWLQQVNEYIDANINYCIDFFEKNLPKAKVTYPEATYLLWVDFSAYFNSIEELEHAMIQKAGVLLDDGYLFGDEGKMFERINVASPRSVIADCLNRIKRAVIVN